MAKTPAQVVDQRRRAYQATFKGEGQEVLKDLAVFCGSTKSSFSRDPLEMAHREGRREVWLRIQSHMKLTEDDIWQLFERERDSVDVDE